MQVSAVYPGSFGEIIQGRITGKDILLSCPINMFTKVEMFETKTVKNNYNTIKCRNFMKNILNNWGYERYFNQIDIKVTSEIPIGKGLASSTADLSAVYLCLIKMFNKQLSMDEFIDNCLFIEPTDSIIFSKFTLFEYKNGKYKENIGEYFKFYILAFEGEKLVNTVDFNKNTKVPLENVEDLVPTLKDAIINKNINNLGKVSTESIIRNLKRLDYKEKDLIIDIMNNTGGLGIIGAHSGNALGVIYYSKESLIKALESINFKNFYKVYPLETLDNWIFY